MKEAHDRFGMKVQLNVFYRTDFFYGNDEFTLTEMTDAYKAEWEQANRGTKDKAIDCSLCGYNHFPADIAVQNRYALKYIHDEETGMNFKQMGGGPSLNLNTLAELEPGFAPLLGNEYIGYGTHEQYFYEDYYNYQPEYPAKVLKAAEILTNAGYTYFFTQDLA